MKIEFNAFFMARKIVFLFFSKFRFWVIVGALASLISMNVKSFFRVAWYSLLLKYVRKTAACILNAIQGDFFSPRVGICEMSKRGTVTDLADSLCLFSFRRMTVHLAIKTHARYECLQKMFYERLCISKCIAFVCTWSMCNLLEGSYLNVGLQPGGTDGATSFRRWLKFHGSQLFPLFSKRKIKCDFFGFVRETQLSWCKQVITRDTNARDLNV